MRCSVFVLVAAASCSKVAGDAAPVPSVLGPTALVSASSVASSVATAPADPAPRGTATLILQKVYSDCGGGERPHFLGTDVLVVLAGDAPGGKPSKEFAFCPSRGADGGVLRPNLQIWQNCSSFPSCQIGMQDSGHSAYVQCGKEGVSLEIDGNRTVIRGSFGVREIAPHPMNLAPVKLETRHAYIDC